MLLDPDVSYYGRAHVSIEMTANSGDIILVYSL